MKNGKFREKGLGGATRNGEASSWFAKMKLRGDDTLQGQRLVNE